MLRPIKHSQLRPRLIGYRTTLDGAGANTPSFGKPLGTFAAEGGSNHISKLTLNNPFSRTPVVVCSPGNLIAAGGAVQPDYSSGISKSIIRSNGGNGSGAADAGEHYVLALGWDSEDTNVYGGRYKGGVAVSSQIRASRLIAAKIDGTGTAAVSIGSSDVSLTDNGTGDYTLTFKRPFAQAPIVVVTPVVGAADGIGNNVTAVSRSSCQILTFDAANSAVDADFYVMILGFDRASDSLTAKATPVECSQRKPRLLAFAGAYSAGVPSLSIAGTGDGTLTDTGTGQLTINFTEAFAREPVVIAGSSDTEIWTNVGVANSSSIRLDFTDASGTLGDPGNFSCLVLGFDDATEY